MSTEDVVAEACPLISQLGGLFYFEAEALAEGAALGLDPLQFYVLGRGGVFGDAEAVVVHSALGYFAPSMVTALWESARAIVSPREGARAYLRCCQDFGRRHLSGIRDLEAFCRAAETVRDAASPIGLPMFAGAAAEPLAGDAPGRAMQLVTVLREFRGGAHMLAVVACRLDPKVAHYASRPDVFFNFGYGPDDIPRVSDQDRARLRAAGDLTDLLMVPAFGVLDPAGETALIRGLRAMRAAIPDPA